MLDAVGDDEEGAVDGAVDEGLGEVVEGPEAVVEEEDDVERVTRGMMRSRIA